MRERGSRNTKTCLQLADGLARLTRANERTVRIDDSTSSATSVE